MPAVRRKRLTIWINYLASLPDMTPGTESPVPIPKASPPPGLMRRLTHSQYNNSVRDLLNDQTRPADQFPQEDFVGGFKNQADGQSIPPLLAEAYSAAAERLTQNAYRSGVLAKLLPCPASATADSSCRARFVRHFGLNAFRRPLAESEVRQYSELFAREQRRSGDESARSQAGCRSHASVAQLPFSRRTGP